MPVLQAETVRLSLRIWTDCRQGAAWSGSGHTVVAWLQILDLVRRTISQDRGAEFAVVANAVAVRIIEDRDNRAHNEGFSIVKCTVTVIIAKDLVADASQNAQAFAIAVVFVIRIVHDFPIHVRIHAIVRR